MFFTNYSTYEGKPVRLYRTPEEIRRDISTIKDKIEMTSDMLNIRSILTDMITECAVGEPQRWIPALKSIVEDAETTLESLRTLTENLDNLKSELEETKCVLGV